MRATLLKTTAIALTLVVGSAALAAGTETARAMDQFLEVFNEVKRTYVDQVSDQQLIKGAIQGMLSSLDPHSSYLTGTDYDNLKIMTEGSYGGLGLTVSMEDGTVKVIAAQEDTPADRIGIKSGDYITHLDGKLLFGGTLDEAVSSMRGKAGTKIALTLVRLGRDKPIEVAITREMIVQKPVKWEVKGDVGYININSFSESTGADTRAAIMAIEKSLGHRPLGYVVDLRENGGGLLSQAIAVSDAFLDGGEIVSQRGRGPETIERYFATVGDNAQGLPVIVLTDSGTASASEIVAGALQDHHRAIVMGERTFGKGSVQTVFELGGKRAIRVTTARYFTPSGHSVQEGGIEPDIKVPQLSDPDYKDRPVFREADLRRHLINEIKADNAVLEEDTKDDPRFSATPAALKTQRIDDFQLWYALKTIARVGGATQVAAVTAAMAKDFKPAPEVSAK